MFNLLSVFRRDSGQQEWSLFKKILLEEIDREGFDFKNHWALESQPASLGEVSVRMNSLYYDYGLLRMMNGKQSRAPEEPKGGRE